MYMPASLHQSVTKNQMHIDQFLCLCERFLDFSPFQTAKVNNQIIQFAFEFWSQTVATKRALGCSFPDEVRKTFRKTYFLFLCFLNFSSYYKKGCENQIVQKMHKLLVKMHSIYIRTVSS